MGRRAARLHDPEVPGGADHKRTERAPTARHCLTHAGPFDPLGTLIRLSASGMRRPKMPMSLSIAAVEPGRRSNHGSRLTTRRRGLSRAVDRPLAHRKEM